MWSTFFVSLKLTMRTVILIFNKLEFGQISSVDVYGIFWKSVDKKFSVFNVLTEILQNFINEIIPLGTMTIKKSSFNSHVFWDTLYNSIFFNEHKKLDFSR